MSKVSMWLGPPKRFSRITERAVPALPLLLARSKRGKVTPGKSERLPMRSSSRRVIPSQAFPPLPRTRNME
jgi:hypothetical protein